MDLEALLDAIMLSQIVEIDHLHHRGPYDLRLKIERWKAIWINLNNLADLIDGLPRLLRIVDIDHFHRNLKLIVSTLFLAPTRHDIENRMLIPWRLISSVLALLPFALLPLALLPLSPLVLPA